MRDDSWLQRAALSPRQQLETLSYRNPPDRILAPESRQFTPTGYHAIFSQWLRLNHLKCYRVNVDTINAYSPKVNLMPVDARLIWDVTDYVDH